MNKSRIEWCDFTWNPVTGCRHDCPYCYARAMCWRFAKQWGLDPSDPFKPTFHPERLDEPLRLKKPSRIFVGSMTDLFGAWVPNEKPDYRTCKQCGGIGAHYEFAEYSEPHLYSCLVEPTCAYCYATGQELVNPEKCWVQAILDVVDYCSQHTFIFLTKNPARYAEFDFPPNCWLGVTVTGAEDYAEANAKMLPFLGIRPPGIDFVSWEPILGSFHKDFIDSGACDWLILGAMTGPGAKKYAPRREWIADAVARCRERNIPVFMKNSIRPYWDGELIQGWPGI